MKREFVVNNSKYSGILTGFILHTKYDLWNFETTYTGSSSFSFTCTIYDIPDDQVQEIIKFFQELEIREDE